MSKNSNVTYIPPSGSLKQKLGNKPLDELIDQERLDAAQKAVFNNFDQFVSQAGEELTIMEQQLQEIEKAEFPSPRNIEALENAFFQIKSTSGTFGFPLASSVAKLGFDYLAAHRQLTPENIHVIKAHYTALRSIFRHNIRGDGGSIGKELMQGLKKMVEKFRTPEA